MVFSDNILETGDNLYVLHGINKYPMLENVMSKWESYYETLIIGDLFTGHIMNMVRKNQPYYTLDKAFEILFEHEFTR